MTSSGLNLKLATKLGSVFSGFVWATTTVVCGKLVAEVSVKLAIDSIPTDSSYYTSNTSSDYLLGAIFGHIILCIGIIIYVINLYEEHKLTANSIGYSLLWLVLFLFCSFAPFPAIFVFALPWPYANVRDHLAQLGYRTCFPKGIKPLDRMNQPIPETQYPLESTGVAAYNLGLNESNTLPIDLLPRIELDETPSNSNTFKSEALGTFEKAGTLEHSIKESATSSTDGPAVQSDIFEKLAKAIQFLKDGDITEEEFQTLKADIFFRS